MKATTVPSNDATAQRQTSQRPRARGLLEASRPGTQTLPDDNP